MDTRSRTISGMAEAIPDFLLWGEIPLVWSIGFIVNSVLLGVGLAMDAFSVSMVNGLQDPKMRRRKRVAIAGTFAFFQALMPMTGWFCVHTVVHYFEEFHKFVPWIALFLLLYIGGGMVRDGLRHTGSDEHAPILSWWALFLQGVATSIDALSVGFTIADYGWLKALVCSLIISAVTYVICEAGLFIGRKVGTRLSDKASILGGVILIGIGIEIFVTGVF